MTEKRVDDSKEGDRSAVAKPGEFTPEERRQFRKDLWESLNKVLNTLMVGHAAGLVTCLTLLKDYKDNSQLAGVGWFVVLFGYGLIIAALSVLAWTIGPGDYVVLFGKRFDALRRLDMFSITATCAVMSTVLMALAVLIAVFKLGTL
jgi:hypothetical protein